VRTWCRLFRPLRHLAAKKQELQSFVVYDRYPRRCAGGVARAHQRNQSIKDLGARKSASARPLLDHFLSQIFLKKNGIDPSGVAVIASASALPPWRQWSSHIDAAVCSILRSPCCKAAIRICAFLRHAHPERYARGFGGEISRRRALLRRRPGRLARRRFRPDQCILTRWADPRPYGGRDHGENARRCRKNKSFISGN